MTSEQTTRKYRPCIITADGRRYTGMWPQSVPKTRETEYIIALAKTTSGVCEVTVPAGRADVMTTNTVFEVEPADHWRAGLRQVLAYSAATRTTAALALFGSADYLKIYSWLLRNLPDVELWRWENYCWLHVTSNTAARRRAPDDWRTANKARDDAYESGLRAPKTVPAPLRGVR